MRMRVGLGIGLVWASLTAGGAAEAVGTFQWQLQPFCNLLTLSVRQDGGVYTLDGSDDQCGAGERASVAGTAFLNPDGSIGLGLATVGAPGAAPVVLHARIALATVSGTWRDSAGNSGAFVFTPGAGTGGAARPVPPNGIRPGSVTAAQLAPGAVGAAQIALGAIGSAQLAAGAVTATHLADASVTAAKLAPGTVQVPITGTCPVGRYLRGVTPAGAVICEPFFAPATSTAVSDSPAAGSYSSIAIGADGLPVISHVDVTAGALRVTKCGNAACTADNLSINADDPATSMGGFTAIAIGRDGLPVIGYRDVTVGALRVTKCGRPTCTTGNVSTTVDTLSTGVGAYAAIAIGADGLPVISHVDDANRGLRVTKCGNAACTAGNVSTTVDSLPAVFVQYTSIAIGDDDTPIIAYQDLLAGALRVTKCGTQSCR